MDGARIARYDLAQISNLANIDALQKEMIHKAKTLKTQLSTNPGLKPVFKQYLKHVRDRRASVNDIIQYMSSLLISLNSIPLTENADEEKMHSDQNVIVYEINRLKEILAELNTVKDVSDDDDASDDNNN